MGGAIQDVLTVQRSWTDSEGFPAKFGSHEHEDFGSPGRNPLRRVPRAVRSRLAREYDPPGCRHTLLSFRVPLFLDSAPVASSEKAQSEARVLMLLKARILS
ncbi:unnamed protein product [Prorocentrum cordatum]|uniref:Uncharacterized protein n=1 Tax=Prorocentrum cordatum TaxID=2364126 RepID=A0ABN9XAI7_9DINO|nr:unnamed protein product [Polarella glacialis]